MLNMATELMWVPEITAMVEEGLVRLSGNSSNGAFGREVSRIAVTGKVCPFQGQKLDFLPERLSFCIG